MNQLEIPHSLDSSVSTIAGSPVDHRSMAVKVYPDEEHPKDTLASRGARLKSFMGEDDTQQVKKTSSKAEKNEIKQKLQFIEPTGKRILHSRESMSILEDIFFPSLEDFTCLKPVEQGHNVAERECTSSRQGYVSAFGDCLLDM